MKIFLFAAACCAFAFAGCERHPVSQVQQLNEESEANPEKKKNEATREQAQARPEASASPSARTYFPASSK
ncbi:MAG: hypothetical protein JOY92_02900 [Verrucomicrobia bacterium]|nr:hypothetical protein [Verrucomicrobiota bacterium]